MTMRPSSLAVCGAFLASLAWPGSACAQQSYPVKPITIILPYAPGGSTSVLAYLIRQKLTESWGHQALMVHRPGGNATIGAAAAAKAAPDGYTIVFVTATHVITPFLMSVPYDAIKDFAPITPVTSVELLCVVHPSVPVKSVKELVALAKSRPGKLNYAVSSAGGTGHLAVELFSMKVGIHMQAIAYKGGAPAAADVVAGQVDLMFPNPINVMHFVHGGKLRAIAVSGNRRLPSLPDVPTFAEAGVADLAVSFWQGVLAPAGTPQAIVDKLAAEISRIMTLPDIKEKVTSMGVETFVLSPEQFGARMRADTVRYAEVIKKRNIKID